jgi:hypothetical protein
MLWDALGCLCFCVLPPLSLLPPHGYTCKCKAAMASVVFFLLARDVVLSNSNPDCFFLIPASYILLLWPSLQVDGCHLRPMLESKRG